jgi:hypothetical protein
MTQEINQIINNGCETNHKKAKDEREEEINKGGEETNNNRIS